MKHIRNILLLILFGSISLYGQTLEDYFKIASENNPGLQKKYKDFEMAMKKIPQVSSLPDPNLSFGIFISPVETRVGPQVAKFSLSQMFPWFGTLKANENAAALMAESKYQEFLDARNKLYYDVAKAFYPLYELEKWKKTEEENIDILNSYISITNKKFENGTGSMVDVLRVDILLKASKTNLEILRKKEAPLVARFNALLNRSESDTVTVSDSLNVNLEGNILEQDSLFSDHPLLKSLDSKIEAAEALERAAVKKGLPKIGVGLDYMIIGKREETSISDNGKDAFMPMVSISIPLFRKKYSAEKEEKQLLQESYSLQKKEIENRLISKYEEAKFNIQKSLDQIHLLNEQITETKQALNLLFSAYGNSGKEFEEVLEMQQKLLKLEKMLATAKVDYHVAIEEIKYITAKNL